MRMTHTSHRHGSKGLLQSAVSTGARARNCVANIVHFVLSSAPTQAQVHLLAILYLYYLFREEKLLNFVLLVPRTYPIWNRLLTLARSRTQIVPLRSISRCGVAVLVLELEHRQALFGWLSLCRRNSISLLRQPVPVDDELLILLWILSNWRDKP